MSTGVLSLRDNGSALLQTCRLFDTKPLPAHMLTIFYDTHGITRMPWNLGNSNVKWSAKLDICLTLNKIWRGVATDVVTMPVWFDVFSFRSDRIQFWHLTEDILVCCVKNACHTPQCIDKKNTHGFVAYVSLGLLLLTQLCWTSKTRAWVSNYNHVNYVK